MLDSCIKSHDWKHFFIVTSKKHFSLFSSHHDEPKNFPFFFCVASQHNTHRFWCWLVSVCQPSQFLSFSHHIKKKFLPHFFFSRAPPHFWTFALQASPSPLPLLFVSKGKNIFANPFCLLLFDFHSSSLQGPPLFSFHFDCYKNVLVAMFRLNNQEFILFYIFLTTS